MKPDELFVKKLKEIDPKLDVVWSQSLGLFCIFYTTGEGRTFKITEVREDDGSYRPLDDRTINKLRSWDKSRSGMSAGEIAQKQYENFQNFHKEQKLKRRKETKYKAKQLVSWWKKAAEYLYDKKKYSDTPMKPYILNEMSRAKALQQNDLPLIQKLGVPHLHGDPKLINP